MTNLMRYSPFFFFNRIQVLIEKLDLHFRKLNPSEGEHKIHYTYTWAVKTAQSTATLHSSGRGKGVRSCLTIAWICTNTKRTARGITEVGLISRQNQVKVFQLGKFTPTPGTSHQWGWSGVHTQKDENFRRKWRSHRSHERQRADITYTTSCFAELHSAALELHTKPIM